MTFTRMGTIVEDFGQQEEHSLQNVIIDEEVIFNQLGGGLLSFVSSAQTVRELC